jgi:hypothetical protein
VRRGGEEANSTQGTEREKNRRQGEDLLTEGGKEWDEVAGDGGRRWGVESPRTEENWRQLGKRNLWLGFAGWRHF